MSNPNFSLSFGGPAFVSDINPYVTYFEMCVKPLRKVKTAADLFMSAGNVTFSLAALGSGDTNSGRMVLNKLLLAEKAKGLTACITVFGEQVNFEVLNFLLWQIAGESKSSIVEFKASLMLGERLP